MKFKSLTVGELFRAHGSAWTKIDLTVARKHPRAAIELGPRGYGYHGAVCSFDEDEEVEFLPLQDACLAPQTDSLPDVPKCPDAAPGELTTIDVCPDRESDDPYYGWRVITT